MCFHYFVSEIALIAVLVSKLGSLQLSQGASVPGITAAVAVLAAGAQAIAAVIYAQVKNLWRFIRHLGCG